MLGHVGIGARDQDAVVRIMRAAGPDLLAVDDPVGALLFRLGAQPRHVGTGRRLGKQLAPDVRAGGERRQVVLLLLFAGVGHHGRPAHALPDQEHAGELAVDALFLLPDHPLDRRGAAAAILLRPVQTGPAGIGFLALPGLRGRDDVTVIELDAPDRRPRQLGLQLFRSIGVDPVARRFAKGGFLRRVVEIHGRDPLFYL